MPAVVRAVLTDAGYGGSVETRRGEMSADSDGRSGGSHD